MAKVKTKLTQSGETLTGFEADDARRAVRKVIDELCSRLPEMESADALLGILYDAASAVEEYLELSGICAAVIWSIRVL